VTRIGFPNNLLDAHSLANHQGNKPTNIIPKIGLPLGTRYSQKKEKKKPPYCSPLLNDTHIYVKLNWHVVIMLF